MKRGLVADVSARPVAVARSLQAHTNQSAKQAVSSRYTLSPGERATQSPLTMPCNLSCTHPSLSRSAALRNSLSTMSLLRHAVVGSVTCSMPVELDELVGTAPVEDKCVGADAVLSVVCFSRDRAIKFLGANYATSSDQPAQALISMEVVVQLAANCLNVALDPNSSIKRGR